MVSQEEYESKIKELKEYLDWFLLLGTVLLHLVLD